MTEQVKVFFEQLEEKSKDNPMLKVEFAAKEISAQIQQACLDDKKVIMGDWCLYMASVLAGISCIKSSKADIIKMRAKIDLNSNSIPLVDVDTVAGKFYVGDLINKYLVKKKSNKSSKCTHHRLIIFILILKNIYNTKYYNGLETGWVLMLIYV